MLFRAIARTMSEEDRDNFLRQYNSKINMEQLLRDYDDAPHYLDENNIHETITAYALRQFACDNHNNPENIKHRSETLHCSDQEAENELRAEAQMFRNAREYATNEIILSLAKAFNKDIVIIRPATIKGEYRVTRIHCQTSDQPDTVIKSDDAFVVYYNGTNHYEYVDHDGSYSQLNDGEIVYGEKKAKQLKRATELKESKVDKIETQKNLERQLDFNLKSNQNTTAHSNTANEGSSNHQLAIKVIPKIQPQPVSLVSAVFEKIFNFIQAILKDLSNTVHAIARTLKIR